MTEVPPRTIRDALEREEDLWKAYVAAEPARLEELLHDEALDVGPWGVRSRDEVIAAVARMHISSFRLFDIRYSRASSDVEIVTYRASVNGTSCGKPFQSAEVAATSVWAKLDETWRLMHRCEFPVAAATSPDHDGAV